MGQYGIGQPHHSEEENNQMCALIDQIAAQIVRGEVDFDRINYHMTECDPECQQHRTARQQRCECKDMEAVHQHDHWALLVQDHMGDLEHKIGKQMRHD